MCRLAEDNNLALLPLDKGSPPPWYPAFAGVEGVYVERELFDKLKKRRYGKPCDICPDEVKTKCVHSPEGAP